MKREKTVDNEDKKGHDWIRTFVNLQVFPKCIFLPHEVEPFRKYTTSPCTCIIHETCSAMTSSHLLSHLTIKLVFFSRCTCVSLTKEIQDHFMSWEHPWQSLNHRTQPHRHYISASDVDDQILQFPPNSSIPFHRRSLSSESLNVFLTQTLTLHQTIGLSLTLQPFFFTSIAM